MIEYGDSRVSVSRQCELWGLARSTLYYLPRAAKPEEEQLLRLVDEQYTRTPFYGARKITAWLRAEGWRVNRKRVQRLMRQLGLQAIYPKPNLSRPRKDHPKYPYLLRGLEISRANQVWATDITYIRLRRGFIYLVAIMDWYSRYVLSWEASISLEPEFCVAALQRAVEAAVPEIFNSDQGCQFTSEAFLGLLQDKEIRISMDGRGRALDNVFVERLWRTVKYEEVYLKEYETVIEAVEGLKSYFEFYNHQRLHQALGYRTPAEVYFSSVEVQQEALCVERA